MLIGSRLGPYEITAKLGEGGMGEVYRATDTKLERQVAIKVLPGAFTEDPERLARFEREAKLLAQLHHPNIASIFGLEESEGTRALVMELVEGPTLAERLASGPLPLEESLSIARQIAEALEEAHDKGIVHRDLKPQNVKASIEGKVKVLDFGLAKAMDPTAGSAPSVADLARSPTLMQSPTLTAAHGTQLGVILGTAAYMAPEQAKGMPVDKRADIWAFGVLVYEMLVGGSLFVGDTVTDTLAGVLKTEIDFARLPAATPAAIRRLLRRCLERNPKQRLHDIADARLVIEETIRADGAAEPGAVPLPTSRASSKRELVAWGAAALAVLAALALLAGRAPRRGVTGGAAAGVLRFAVVPEEQGTLEGFPALSPDGRTLVFSLLDEQGQSGLWAHSFESGASRRLAGTEGGDLPFWSPDGRLLAFFAGGQLKRLDVASGLIQSLRRVPDPRGGAWTADGEFLLSINTASPIVRYSPGSGESRTVTKLTADQGEQSHRFPWELPGGAFLYTSIGAEKVAGIYWQADDTAPARRLLPDVSRAVYDGRGTLFWCREGTLLGQRFDPAKGELSGEPTPIGDGVGIDPQKTSSAWFAVSASGTLAFRRGGVRVTELVWFDRAGKPLGAVASPGSYWEPMLSPDGRQVVVGGGQFGDSIWIYDTTGVDRGRRLTFESAETGVWSPDGRWLAYSAPRANGYVLLRKAADGSGQEELLFESGMGSWIDAWSPDGKRLLFERFDPERGGDLWLLSLEGERKAEVLLASPANESHAALSPDGRLVAYVSDEGGVGQVYVETVPPSGSRWQVSSDGGDWPAWRADGKEIYFAGFDRMLHAVPVSSLAPFTFGGPEALFRLRTPQPAITSNRTYFAPAADGQRFLVLQLSGNSEGNRIDVVANWTAPEATR